MLNVTYELTDIFSDYMKNSSLPAYIICTNVQEVVITFLRKKVEEFIKSENNANKDLGCSLNFRLEGMEDVLKSSLKDFNIDGVNLLDEPNLGLMIAVMVTSTKYPEEEPRETGICSRQGKFCYVYNFTMPDFSELGYCFFEQDKDYNIIRQG